MKEARPLIKGNIQFGKKNFVMKDSGDSFNVVIKNRTSKTFLRM